jgi:DNA processing protein
VSKAEWVALGTLPGVGGSTLRRLLARFGSLDAILAAGEAELLAVARIGPRTAAALRQADVPAAERLLYQLSNEGISTLTWDDADYPTPLRELRDAPPVLFVRGGWTPADACAIAIVGTRTPTPAAAQAAARLAAEMAGRGVSVVSGLAIGVDTAAHRGALAAGGRTLAILGSGLHKIHPRSNADLAETIAGQGALLSEWHPDCKPAPAQLVARNRLISALSLWTVIVESGVAGGSMRAAEFARRQGRVVAAVPGSAGAEALLAAGALPIDVQNQDWDALAERIRQTKPAPAGAPRQLDLPIP